VYSIIRIELDAERNEVDGKGSAGLLTPDGKWRAVLDIATDEDATILRECFRLVPRQRIPSHLQENIDQHLGFAFGLD
jgi:acetate kinase